MTRIMPKSESTLMVMPSALARMNMPANEIGIARATQKASRQCRNMASNTTTMIKPRMPFSDNRLMRCRRSTDPSRMRLAWTTSFCVLNPSMYSVTFSVMEIISSWSVFCTVTTTEGLPLRKLRLGLSAHLSRMEAIWCR